MTFAYHACQTEDDYWRLREFLRTVFVLNDRLERSWHVARLDYARWHGCMNCAKLALADLTFMWEAQGQVQAMLMAEGGFGDVHLAVHPHLRSGDLENEMLAVAEERLADVARDGSRRLTVWVPAEDVLRRELVQQRGYRREGNAEHQWRRDLNGAIDHMAAPPGYTIRSLGDGLELLERCYASGLGFHQGDIQIAVENRDDPAWYRNIQTAPLYRRDLDLVAVTQYGAIAAFCTIWLDDVTRSAYFEPVATIPAHRRRGLSKALLTEGLRRLQRLGATRAFVGGYSMEANALYRSVMGPEHDLYEPWLKEWS